MAAKLEPNGAKKDSIDLAYGTTLNVAAKHALSILQNATFLNNYVGMSLQHHHSAFSVQLQPP